MSELDLILAPPPALPRWKSGQYYDLKSALAGSTGAGAAMSAGTIYASPLFAPEARRVDRIGTDVTIAAAAGKLIRFGLATMGADGLPDVLLADTGSVAADATGGIEGTVDLWMPAGWSWGLMLSDGAPTVLNYTLTQTQGLLGWSSLASTTLQVTATKTQAYGALPAAFGTPTALSNVGFRIAVRAA